MKKLTTTFPQQQWGTVKTKYPSDSIYVNFEDLTGSSKNFDSILHGVLSKRPGGTSYGTFTGIGKDQFEAIFTDGIHHLLVVAAGVLKFSSGGGTFADVTSGYSSLGNFEFGLYQDRVYFDNGIDSPQVYDRTTNYGGVAYTAPRTKAMGAQPPVSAPTFAADTAGGNVPAGAHTYKVTFLYYGAEESNGGPASTVHTVANPNNTVNLTSVPVGGYGVTARKIYRDNNDGAWLLVGTILDNTTTTFQDTASVGTASVPTTNNTPPIFKLIVTHLDRAWIAGVAGDPSALYFSAAGFPDIFPSANRILCNPEDPITGLYIYNNKVIVFNRRSIGQILGDTSDTFQYASIPSSVGCVDNRSIQVRTISSYPTLIWLSDKGIYGTNGYVVTYLSDPIEDLVNLNIQQASQVRGQNAQASQTAFQAGTSSPGIDLISQPGKITTQDPDREWQAEADWEGGSSLTNIATHDGSNAILVPTRHAPALTDGSLSGLQIVGGNVQIPVGSNFTGEDHSSDSNNTSINFTADPTYYAQPVRPPVNGTVTSISVRVPGVSGGASGHFRIRAWADAGGVPGSPVYTGGFRSNPSGADGVFTDSVSIPVTGGSLIWIGMEQSKFSPGTINAFIGTTAFPYTSSQVAVYSNNNSTWTTINTLQNGLNSLMVGYGYSQAAVASAGLWTGPIHDSFSDSAVASTITVSSSTPSGTQVTVTVEASNDSSMLTGITTQSFVNLNGFASVSTTNLRYWRVKILLNTNDNRVTPSAGPPTLTYSTTGIWISEVIDHTTDIVSLNSLEGTRNVPAGTSVTREIATSADNITYTAYGPIGSAVVQRYSKVRVTMTTTPDNVTTPNEVNLELDWTITSNLVSSAIDTGATPAGWDIFQSQFATNGGTVAFFMRSASTLIGLSVASFVAVTNGTFPAVPVNEFVQWKVVLTSTADNVPTVTSVTVNWFISQTTSIRVASLFFNRSYYLFAAEYNQTTNNVGIVLDGTGQWRIYRDINVNAISYFFNAPYFSSATEGRVVQFLSGTTDLGSAIQMVVDSKALDFGDLEHTKVCRKVYLKGKNTGAVFTVQVSFDNGVTWNPTVDVLTGLSTFTTLTDGNRFRRRFVPSFLSGQPTAGKTVKIRVVESTTAQAEIDQIKVEAWQRQGELIS